LSFGGSISFSAILTISSVNTPVVHVTLLFTHYFLGLSGSFFLSIITFLLPGIILLFYQFPKLFYGSYQNTAKKPLGKEF